MPKPTALERRNEELKMVVSDFQIAIEHYYGLAKNDRDRAMTLDTFEKAIHVATKEMSVAGLRCPPPSRPCRDGSCSTTRNGCLAGKVSG